MTKLIIVDDERVIRETISKSIKWEEIGIELVGICKNGIEAYDMILDESPDIVMTDIQMPGLSGLELIQEISKLNLPISFIVLSGYDEFEYARTAMQYGVKQYLLKPSSEVQIRESVIQSIKDIREMKMRLETLEQKNMLLNRIMQDAMYHLIAGGLAAEADEVEADLNRLIESYSKYMDFYYESYKLYKVFYLEQKDLKGFLQELKTYNTENSMQGVYSIYVKNTLLLFEPNGYSENVIDEVCSLRYPEVKLEVEDYVNLSELLKVILKKIRRYDIINIIREESLVTLNNNYNIIQRINNAYKIFDNPGDNLENTRIDELCTYIAETVDPIDDLECMRLVAGNIIMHFSAIGVCTTMDTTEFLMKINQMKDLNEIKNALNELLEKSRKQIFISEHGYGELAQTIMEYVENNISDSKLTLKKIAEQHLFLNVDYVSRQFQKSTGRKFSQYLTEERIKKAKELLLEEGGGKVILVAEQVGYGGNSQYFSQIFKKIAGVTPSKWVQQMKNV